jgi:hypothetical protein
MGMKLELYEHARLIIASVSHRAGVDYEYTKEALARSPVLRFRSWLVGSRPPVMPIGLNHAMLRGEDEPATPRARAPRRRPEVPRGVRSRKRSGEPPRALVVRSERRAEPAVKCPRQHPVAGQVSYQGNWRGGGGADAQRSSRSSGGTSRARALARPTGLGVLPPRPVRPPGRRPARDLPGQAALSALRQPPESQRPRSCSVPNEFSATKPATWPPSV